MQSQPLRLVPGWYLSRLESARSRVFLIQVFCIFPVFGEGDRVRVQKVAAFDYKLVKIVVIHLVCHRFILWKCWFCKNTQKEAE